MFPSKALLCLLLLALFPVDASPLSRRDSGLPNLRLETRIDERAMRNIAEIDRARARALHQDGQLGKRSGSTASVSVMNQGKYFVANVEVGQPATKYQLLVSTATGNTFVGANMKNPYVQSSTSFDTGNPVLVPFDFGSSCFGEEWLDTVTLSSGGSSLVIENQSIGAVSNCGGLDGFDGMLGLGPVGLTDGTVANTGQVPTVADNIYLKLASGGNKLHRRSSEQTGYGARPQSSGVQGRAASSQAVLTFGGVDQSAFTGQVKYVPITTTSPASSYWGIDLSVAYGGTTILSASAGVVDIGTSMILLPTDAYNQYMKLTGSIQSPTGLPSITPVQYASLQTLTFDIGGVRYGLIPDAQIWPRSLNTAIGGSSTGIYLVIGDSGKNSGSGLDVVIGHAFFERFYAVFDTGSRQVGFAQTPYTKMKVNY